MREWFRRWLGLEEDRRAAQAAAQGVAVAMMEKTAELEGRVAALSEAVAAAGHGPEMQHAAECPNGHTGLMVMAVLEHVDTHTGGREAKGFGLYCPKCRSSFYSFGGVRWAAEGNSTEVAAGMEPHTPAGVVRDPEPKPRPLRFRR